MCAWRPTDDVIASYAYTPTSQGRDNGKREGLWTPDLEGKQCPDVPANAVPGSITSLGASIATCVHRDPLESMILELVDQAGIEPATS